MTVPYLVVYKILLCINFGSYLATSDNPINNQNEHNYDTREVKNMVINKPPSRSYSLAILSLGLKC